MPKIPVRLVFRILPAVLAAVEEIVEAVAKDSDGGKKITPDELRDIAEAAADKLKPVLAAELAQVLATEE
jgi:hypothetical protein